MFLFSVRRYSKIKSRRAANPPAEAVADSQTRMKTLLFFLILTSTEVT
jgi:hypothetical protein